MKPTRIAFLSAGDIAEAQAAALRQLRGPRLIAAVDPGASRAASLAKRRGAVTVYDSPQRPIAAVVHILVPHPCTKPSQSRFSAPASKSFSVAEIAGS